MKHCVFCNVPLVRKEREDNRAWARRRFCNRSCATYARAPARTAERLAREQARKKPCAICGTLFVPLTRRDRPMPYCSRQCAGIAKRGRRFSYIVQDMGYVTPCWVWQGAPSDRGYAKTTHMGQTALAHRVVYEEHVGPIPDDLDLDHLCEVRMCVRPDHLDPCTKGENTHRSWVRGRHDAKRALT